MFKIDKKPTIFITVIMIVTIITSIILFYVNFSQYFGIDSEFERITFFSFWWFLMCNDLFAFLFYISPLFIPIITCYAFFKIYHSGYLTNLIQRDNFNNIIKKQILYSWLKNLIIPTISLIFFIISMLLFPNGNFIYSSVSYQFTGGHAYMEILNPLLFVLLHLILTFLYGIFITNISLILTRFIKKFSLLTIATFVITMIIESIGNFILGPTAKMITGYDRMANGFSILNIFYLNGIPNLWWEFIWIIILNLITTFIIYKIYSNKESILNNYE